MYLWRNLPQGQLAAVLEWVSGSRPAASVRTAPALKAIDTTLRTTKPGAGKPPPRR